MTIFIISQIRTLGKTHIYQSIGFKLSEAEAKAFCDGGHRFKINDDYVWEIGSSKSGGLPEFIYSEQSELVGDCRHFLTLSSKEKREESIWEKTKNYPKIG